MGEPLVIGFRNGRKLSREASAEEKKIFMPCGRWELQRVVADNTK